MIAKQGSNTQPLAASSHPGHRSGIQKKYVLDSGLRRNDDRYFVACHGVVHVALKEQKYWKKECTLEESYEKIQELARPYLNTRKNDIHTDISTRFAYLLLELEGGTEEVVIPAILLHDVGWKMVPEDIQLKAFGPKASLPEWNRVHEVEGAGIAGEIFKKVGYDQEKVKEIVHIIEGHDSRKEAFSLNDAIVKDADKLWRYSKEALEINSDRFQLSLEEGIERLRRNIEPWFLTDSAKRMAREEIEKRLQEKGNRKSEPQNSDGS